MVLSMIIVGLVAAISIAIVLWGTPPLFVPMRAKNDT
jgi:hypothetical protein